MHFWDNFDDNMIERASIKFFFVIFGPAKINQTSSYGRQDFFGKLINIWSQLFIFGPTKFQNSEPPSRKKSKVTILGPHLNWSIFAQIYRIKHKKMTLTRVIACSLKIGETLPFLQLKPKLATIFFSEMLLFWHTFNLISLV